MSGKYQYKGVLYKCHSSTRKGLGLVIDWSWTSHWNTGPGPASGRSRRIRYVEDSVVESIEFYCKKVVMSQLAGNFGMQQGILMSN